MIWKAHECQNGLWDIGDEVTELLALCPSSLEVKVSILRCLYLQECFCQFYFSVKPCYFVNALEKSAGIRGKKIQT